MNTNTINVQLADHIDAIMTMIIEHDNGYNRLFTPPDNSTRPVDVIPPKLQARIAQFSRTIRHQGMSAVANSPEYMSFVATAQKAFTTQWDTMEYFMTWMKDCGEVDDPENVTLLTLWDGVDWLLCYHEWYDVPTNVFVLSFLWYAWTLAQKEVTA